jgi:hypothetical protein
MVNLMDLKSGQCVRLRSGAVGEVIDNLGDGIWVQLRIQSSPDSDHAAGEEELIHCEEIVALAEAP